MGRDGDAWITEQFPEFLGRHDPIAPGFGACILNPRWRLAQATGRNEDGPGKVSAGQLRLGVLGDADECIIKGDDDGLLVGRNRARLINRQNFGGFPNAIQLACELRAMVFGHGVVVNDYAAPGAGASAKSSEAIPDDVSSAHDQAND